MSQRQDETIRTEAIDSTGTIFEHEIVGDAVVSINIEGDAAADYALDVSATGGAGDWFEAEETYSGTDIRDAFRLGDRYLRIRVTAAAAAGDEATVTVQEAR